jgi:Acyl-CoA dehydrogenase, middle domain/Acyl-CoA dehydrogenase, N-terminal domain
MEINRGDGSLGAFLAIQSGLVMKAIHLLGSDEQRQRWLPRLARLDAFGAFALTEPLHGSDSVALEATARRDRDEYVISGHKRWIGNASFADVTVVWARDSADGQVKGFLVEKGTPGFGPRSLPGRRRSGRSGRPTSRSPRRGSPPGTGCPEPAPSKTPAGSWRPAATWSPGWPSAMRWPPTSALLPTPPNASSSAGPWPASSVVRAVQRTDVLRHDHQPRRRTRAGRTAPRRDP